MFLSSEIGSVLSEKHEARGAVSRDTVTSGEWFAAKNETIAAEYELSKQALTS